MEEFNNEKIMFVLRYYQDYKLIVKTNDIFIQAPKKSLFNDKNDNFFKENNEKIYDVLNYLSTKNVNISILSDDGVEHQII